MGEVTEHYLCEHTDDALDRVGRGETLIVTRAGVPIAELRPRMNARMLLERFRGLPAIDFEEFRADIDAVIDPRL